MTESNKTYCCCRTIWIPVGESVNPVVLVFDILPPSDIEDLDIVVELDSKGWYVVKSIDTVVPDLDKGELSV